MINNQNLISFGFTSEEVKNMGQHPLGELKMSEEKNKPIQVYRLGNVSASVWKNEFPIKGTEEKGVNLSVTLQRSYKDKDGNWANSDTLNRDDLPKAIVVMQQCYTFIFGYGKE